MGRPFGTQCIDHSAILPLYNLLTFINLVLTSVSGNTVTSCQQKQIEVYTYF